MDTYTSGSWVAAAAMRLLSQGSAWLSVECLSAERALSHSRLAADIAADNWHCGCPTGRRTTLWIAAVLTIICLRR
jgi:hypothetical protein